ncbi:hypothetical protein [Lichenicola sp.]|uniref:hypothetical protein n=1 Tax=Lichenicola sp. TaxID=2804529 RepID=UPI003AFFE8C7
MTAVRTPNLGSPAAAIFLAPSGCVKWNRRRRHDPDRPSLDRLALSAGHASMPVASLMVLPGVTLQPMSSAGCGRRGIC